MRRSVLAVVLLAAACTSDQITAPPSELTGTPPTAVTVYAAGDIAGGSSSYRDKETSDLVVADPSALAFTLGDNVYPDGTLAQFQAYYAPTWGRYKDRTWPVPGNHDYHTVGQAAGAPGYFTYFGSRAPAKYHAQDIGAWRWYFLNSELGTSGASATSAQGNWLKADLAAHPHVCVGASWHKPLYTSYGVSRAVHAPATFMRPLAQILYDAGADLILAGHNHLYERHTQVNPAGQTDPKGPRAFTVGTGGSGLATTTPTTMAPTSQKIILATHGLLRLNLSEESYAWEFVPIAGQSGNDAGTALCSGSGSPPPPPPPSGIRLVVTKRPSTTVSYALLDWTGATTDSVDVFRNGAKIKRTENDGHMGSTRSKVYEPITYTYKVCNKATTVCSNESSMAFP